MLNPKRYLLALLLLIPLEMKIVLNLGILSSGCGTLLSRGSRLWRWHWNRCKEQSCNSCWDPRPPDRQSNSRICKFEKLDYKVITLILTILVFVLFCWKVVETTRQVGRISFHTAADASYKEMTLHCENLLMGKQQKISSLLNSQLRHESSVNSSPRQHDEENKIATFHPMINSAFDTEVYAFMVLKLIQANSLIIICVLMITKKLV